MGSGPGFALSVGSENLRGVFYHQMIHKGRSHQKEGTSGFLKFQSLSNPAILSTGTCFEKDL